MYMIETNTELLKQIRDFEPQKEKERNKVIYLASEFFVRSNHNDLITEPEKLEDLWNKISEIVDLKGKSLSEDSQRKVDIKVNDLKNKLFQIINEVNNYEEKKEIDKKEIYLYDENELPNILELENKELNYYLPTTAKKLHGMYPDWVNIKLYENNGEKFIRVREFFKDKYFKENYLSNKFLENYKIVFGEEINIREHEHTDNSTTEYSIRLPIETQEDLVNKTNFLVNYIKNNPRIEK